MAFVIISIGSLSSGGVRVRRLGLLFLISVTVPLSLPAQQRPLTLAEAIAMAARVNPTVVQAHGGVRTAGAGVLAAKGAFLPNLNATASGTRSISDGSSFVDPLTGETISGSSTSQSVSFGANTSITLFDGFRQFADLGSANATRDGAEAGLSVEEAASTLQTSRQFYDVLAQGALIGVREASIQREEQKLLIAIAKLSTRSTTISDSLDAVVSLANARLQLLTQQDLLATAEANLGRLVGRDGRVQAADDSSLYRFDLPIDSAALLSEAARSAPVVARAEAQARTTRAQLSSSRSTYWPTLSLTAQTSFSGTQRTNYDLFNARSLSLGLSWPLFNRFSREQQVVQRKVDLETNLARTEDTRRDVLARMASQLSALRTARERINVTRIGVEAARANVQVQQERYRLGSISIVELGQVQDALDRAEENAVNARFDFLRARAEIEAILGRPLLP